MEKADNAFVDVDTSTVDDRRILWILDYWEQLPRQGSLPSPKQIDPLDIPPDVLPFIFKISVQWQDDEPSFVYRLSGTQLTKEYGREITGKTPRLAFPTYYRDLEAGYKIAATRKHPIVHQYHLPIFNREHKKVERLMCPFASDGETVDMLFGCLTFPFRQPG
ncbi:PAS domain-containing protein [Hwanghaeella sp.]|uniref:PAS domain-containing protein n=1 Tax=Hwanghaeella sp. TaxID=2605943 RepID=UPI003CCB7947